ncbi:MAG: intradiol ring-cleavage dioxygenase [Chloroflexota bacterium]
MKQVILTLVVMSLVSACAAVTQTTVPQPSLTLETLATSTPEAATASPISSESVAESTIPAQSNNFFTQNDIALPAPACSGLTQPQTEGPYYTANTPERNILFEEGMEGTRLILVGYVLDQNCNPLPNTWLDFWQADTQGEYDNAGYRLRGHQFTDSQGRYYLETIVPGLYASRPIEHIHVKIKPEGGEELTSQLYFPTQAVEGLTVHVEDRGDHWIGYFNFVVQR